MVGLGKIADAQHNDPELVRWSSLASSSLHLKPMPLPQSDKTIICDWSTDIARPFVPEAFRCQVFDALHSLSHPGIREVEPPSNLSQPVLLGPRSTWMFVDGLGPVFSASVLRHTVTPLSTFLTPGSHFDKLHIDIVGPLPTSMGFSYLLIVIDRFTHWSEAIPLVDITAEAVARAFVGQWITHFGVPSSVTTDQGRQFESSLFTQLMKLLGVLRICTTAYHPIANGIIERFHRQLKAALKALPSPTHWVDGLPMVMLGIRTALKEDIGCSVAELVYGTTLRIPGEFYSSTTADDPISYVTQLKSVMQKL